MKIAAQSRSEKHHTESECPVCKSSNIYIFLEIPNVPVHCNILWKTREEAQRAIRGDMNLGLCEVCGHIFNLKFNSNFMEYTRNYENSLHFSQYFQSYAEQLAVRLIERYDLYNKDIIEIGCGRGEFLRLLCEIGGNRGVGFEPSLASDEQTREADSELITIIRDFYSERYSDYKADFICSRHVLEHIASPRDFLINLRYAICNKSDTIVFFEVPNVDYILEGLGIWDLIYEHISYFSKTSLTHLFTSCGFKINSLADAYNGQFLTIEAALDKKMQIPDTERLANPQINILASCFAGKYHSKIKTWQKIIKGLEKKGQKTVVWGAGSKGVTFLNLLKTQSLIEYVVDINPRKEGMYIAGTGQLVFSPNFLQEYQPDAVILMNPIYKREIRSIIKSLDLTPKLLYA